MSVIIDKSNPLLLCCYLLLLKLVPDRLILSSIPNILIWIKDDIIHTCGEPRLLHAFRQPISSTVRSWHSQHAACWLVHWWHFRSSSGPELWYWMAPVLLVLMKTKQIVFQRFWMVLNVAADQKYVLARKCSVLFKPTVGFRNLFFDWQEVSVKIWELEWCDLLFGSC